MGREPRAEGLVVKGKFARYWRDRFGDYRMIAKIEQERLVVVVLAIGQRREVYR